jgi:hypothetical protein
MDNIQPPQSGQPPQGSQPSAGQGDGSTDQDNPPVTGQPPATETGQDQGVPAIDAGGGEMQPPTGAGPQDQNAAQPAGADQGQVQDVLEGTEGAEGAETPPQDTGAVSSPGFDNQAPADQGQTTEPYAPQDNTGGAEGMTQPTGVPPSPDATGSEQPPALDATQAGDTGVTPQSQPDFTGGAPQGMGPDQNMAPDQGGMPPGPQEPGQVPGAPQKPGGSKWLIIVLVIVVVLALGGLTIAYMKDYISLPFLDKLLGREQATEETTPAETQETAFPEDQQRKGDLVQIKGALEKYFEENQSYPIAKKLEKTFDVKSASYKALVPKYLNEMPIDPVSPTKFYGYQSSDGTSFKLSAVLDNLDDPEGVKKGDLTLYILTNLSEVESSNTTEGTSGTSQ